MPFSFLIPIALTQVPNTANSVSVISEATVNSENQNKETIDNDA